MNSDKLILLAVYSYCSNNYMPTVKLKDWNKATIWSTVFIWLWDVAKKNIFSLFHGAYN